MSDPDRTALSSPPVRPSAPGRAVRSGTARTGPPACGHEPAAGPAAAGAGRPGVPRWAPAALIALGAAMVPWLFVLDAGLPDAARAFHWASAWTGLDLMECAGLLATGWLCRRRDARACLTAVATAALLVADAWFDTVTSAPGAQRALACALAAGTELPLAAGCVVLAVRLLPAAAARGRG